MKLVIHFFCGKKPASAGFLFVGQCNATVPLKEATALSTNSPISTVAFPSTEQLHFVVPHNTMATLLIVIGHLKQLLELIFVVPSTTKFAMAKQTAHDSMRNDGQQE
ncbi:hypothetical protein [Georgfuchsia toluolica]|uniref:hypothetical protein n=1 Tax=Georgfuchsia toluolica TaxID=424218 RepID=UPI001C72FC4E|nr:hypothetical protein [Georgfuchsia toluolica]